MQIGIGISAASVGLGEDNPNPITITTPPVLTALTSDQTPSDGSTQGDYDAPSDIFSIVTSFTVNGDAQGGSYDLEAGDVVQMFDTVTDNDSNVRVVATSPVTVADDGINTLAELQAALAAASPVGGATITLSGTIDTSSLVSGSTITPIASDIDYASPVTISGGSIGPCAYFDKVTNLVLSGIEISDPAGNPDHDLVHFVGDCGQPVVEDCTIHGGPRDPFGDYMAPGAYSNNPGCVGVSADGLSKPDGLIVRRCELYDAVAGVGGTFFGSSGITMEYNEVSKTYLDAFHFAVDELAVSAPIRGIGNVCHTFIGSAFLDEGDPHIDVWQFVAVAENVGAEISDFIFRQNVAWIDPTTARGDGVQGLFVNTSSGELSIKNPIIAGNVMLLDGYHPMSIGNIDGGIIVNNTLMPYSDAARGGSTMKLGENASAGIVFVHNNICGNYTLAGVATYNTAGNRDLVSPTDTLADHFEGPTFAPTSLAEVKAMFDTLAAVEPSGAIGSGYGTYGVARNPAGWSYDPAFEQVNVAEITLDEFSRDRAPFDSGAAFGLSEADVPISGTGTIGRPIEARAISTDDAGATTTSWADVGTVDGSGDWSGTITAPKSASWYRVEARVKDYTAASATMTNRFGVGHVIGIWGQSEPARIVDDFGDSGGLTVPAVVNEDAVQVIYPTGFDPYTFEHVHITNATPGTVSLVHMANALLAERPNDKFCLVFQVRSGTGLTGLVDDADASRNWADDLALHNYATADGQHIGMAAMSWFAAPRSYGGEYEERLFPMLFEKTADGSAFTVPGSQTLVGGTIQIDHAFTEMYDYTKTKWIMHGPHRFEVDNESGIQTCRAEVRSLAANVNDGGAFLPYGLEQLSYSSGYDAGGGVWTDTSHPSHDTSDGAPRFAISLAQAVLQSSGLATWDLPEFDNCAWQPDGSYVEVWSSAGNIITTRSARAETALDNTYDHWTDVFGFNINGTPVHRAEIISGRVRIYPISGSFISTDILTFGAGGATGAVENPADFFAETWKNYPLVDVGQARLEGVPVRAMPDPAVLANTIVGTSTFNVTAAGPKFDQNTVGGTVGAGVSGLTVAMKIRGVSGTATDDLAQLTGNQLFFQMTTAGLIKISVRDSSNTVLVGSTGLNYGVTFGEWNEAHAAINLPLGWAKLFVGGVEVGEATFTSGTNLFSSSERFLGLWNQWAGEVEYLRYWIEATSDGSLPVSTPYEEIVGPAAAANAHPWKTPASADAT